MKKMVRAVLFAMMAVFSTAVFAEEDPCDKPANLTEIYGVYQIGTCGDLYKFAEMVNGGETGINGRLTADIVVNMGVLSSDGTLNGNGFKFIQWTPIGTEEKPYKGTFNGNGHTISGLYFNDENVDYVGLFGFISDKAKVWNVGVVDSYILGRGSVGGVVGFNARGGTIRYVYNTGTVSGTDSRVGGVVGNNSGTVSNVYNTGAVSGDGWVGGVVGDNGGTVSNVYNTGAVSGEDGVGGVVGENDGNISNVYNTGAVSGRTEVGGVVGVNDYTGTVSNVYNTGTVSGDNIVGGVVGQNLSGSVSNVYNTGAVSGYVYVGGVVGNNDGGSVENAYYNTDFYTGDAVGTCDRECEYENVEGKSTAELASTTLPAGFSGEIWNAGSGELVGSNGKLLYKLPGLIDVGSQPEIEYTGFQPNAVGYYEISNAQDLKWFAQLVNSGATSINGRLTADICLNACGEGESVLKADGTLNGDGSNFTQWTPIGSSSQTFLGTFDGQGHTVSGLYFSDENVYYAGLFGFIGDKAKIQNVGVVDSYIRGRYYVGGVVGCNKGTINNVYNTGTVSGFEYVGGVVGQNAGGVRMVYNAGAVTGDKRIGGVVGYNNGDLSNVYNTGAVSGGENVGGVVGFNAGGGTVENAYYNTDFYAWSAVGENLSGSISNAEGKTTAELASTTLPAGFSGEIWNAGSGEPVVRNGKLLFKLPGLKDVGTQPEIEYTGFQPNADGYYEISNAVELKCFAQLVNSGATSINGRLTADICLNACGEGESVLKADGTLNGDGSNFTQWTPIGTVEKPYEGTFDGNGKRISGLYFSDEDVNYVGLFKYNEGIVQNVGVVDSYIRGRYYVGGVVGCNKGTVSNVYNTGAVSGSDEVGGVVGCNKRTISNVYNTGAVSGWVEVGGVVGFNAGNSTVSNVYNTGAVSGNVKVGGVVGWNIDGTVSNVYNTGAVSGLDEVGGVVGNNGGTVENAYYNTDFYAGNALGENKSGSIENVDGKPTGELIAIDFGSEWVAGNLAYDKTTGKLAFGFPYLKNFGNSQYKITALEFKVVDNVIQIANADDLKDFARLVNEFGVTDVDAELTADICLNACGEGESVLKADGSLNGDGFNFKPWTPILAYDGTFDGNGHTISGLYFNDENVNYVGLLGYIGDDAKAQNVGVVDSYIRGAGTVGGVVGLNAGGTIRNVYNTGVVSGGTYVGGVVGNNGGTVRMVYNTGAVSGLGEVGGVVGNNGGTVSNVYNTGAVSGDMFVGGVVGNNGGTVSNVYNTGAVSGTGTVGGVVGVVSHLGTVENAYYNTDSYTGSAVGEIELGEIENVEGKTTIELAALTFGTADADFPLLDDETESPWESGNISYDKVTGKLTASFPYLKNLADFQYKITALEFKVVDNVIQIANADDLKDFARLVSEFGVTDVDAKLTADICLNACGEGESVLKADGTLNGDGSNFMQWTPIGTAEKPYAGTFDGMDAEGNAHVISGLYFNDGNADFVGLFGYIGENAKVQNVGVVDSYFKGKQYVAGVVGYNDGDLSNVYNTGAVSGEYDVGGVVGYNDDDLTNVYNTGTVSGTDDVGGVVGENIGTVSNVYNTGMVSGIDGAGSVVGYNAGSIANAYYDKDVACANCGSRIGGTTGKTTAELAALDVASAFDDSEGNWNAGYSITSNGWWKYAFPSLKGVGTAPTFVKLDPDAIEVEISNVEELFLFAEFVNAGNTLNGRLTADIVVNENLLGTDDANVKDDGTFDMEAYKSAHANAEPRAWTPIGTASTPYRGIFDGKDGEGNVHTISGLYFIDENARGVGLFGYIGGKHAKIQNVGVVDSYIGGRFEVGGVVGHNEGSTVSNVYNTGSVILVAAAGSFVAENAGGVVGYNVSGTVSNVYNTGVLGCTTPCNGVGGVVGYNEDGIVRNVYNTGAVSGKIFVGGVVGGNTGDLSNVYNTGAVSSEDRFVGGVVGGNTYGTVSNGYYNTDMPCENCGSPIEGTTGKATAEFAALDVALAFENSDGVWVAGYDSISNGWRKYAFPSLKGVGTAPTFIELDPNATEVEISNVEELLKFAELVNAGNTTLNAKLTADIVVNEGVLKADGTLNVADTSKFVKWTPIGTDANPYIGTFDGQGHTVRGLYFNNDKMSNVGFFGTVGSDGETKGVVKNVGVVDSYFEGNFFVGGVVGLVMENASVNAVFNTGAVSGQVNVGGVVGVNGGGFVTNVYNTGSVSGEIEDVGGAIGLNVGEARNVYSVGPVSGKFAVGGVVGLNEGGYVANAYYNSEVFEGDSIGGGNGTSENVEGKNSADLVAGATLKLDTTVWVLGAVSENVKQDTLYYPYLKVFGPHKYVLGDVKKYAITVTVNDETMGTVTGAGEYEYGTEVEITATANEGYKFTDWEDDVKASAERTIVVTGNITYTANFEAIPSSSSEVESSSSVAESSSSVDESSSSEAASSSSEAKSSSSEAKSSSSSAKSSSSSAKSSSSEAVSSSSDAKSSSSDAKSSSSEAKSSSSSAKSSSSSAKSSSSEMKSSSSEAESSSSEAKSSSSDAKSSSSQKESIIAQAQLPQFSVTASGKMVSIAGARPNSIVNVFDMQGNRVKTVVATSANFTFALPSAGVYIVKNGYTAKRVNVR